MAQTILDSYQTEASNSPPAPGKILLDGMDIIVQAAFGEPLSSAAKQQKQTYLHTIDHMVDMLVYAPGLRFQEVGWGAALLPDSFWLTLAGRAIVLALNNILGDDFCSLLAASEQMNTNPRKLYTLANTKQLPYYLHPGIRNPKQKRRVRLDHLALLLDAGELG